MIDEATLREAVEAALWAFGPPIPGVIPESFSWEMMAQRLQAAAPILARADKARIAELEAELVEARAAS